MRMDMRVIPVCHGYISLNKVQIGRGVLAGFMYQIKEVLMQCNNKITNPLLTLLLIYY